MEFQPWFETDEQLDPAMPRNHHVELSPYRRVRPATEEELYPKRLYEDPVFVIRENLRRYRDLASSAMIVARGSAFADHLSIEPPFFSGSKINCYPAVAFWFRRHCRYVMDTEHNSSAMNALMRMAETADEIRLIESGGEDCLRLEFRVRGVVVTGDELGEYIESGLEMTDLLRVPDAMEEWQRMTESDSRNLSFTDQVWKQRMEAAQQELKQELRSDLEGTLEINPFRELPDGVTVLKSRIDAAQERKFRSALNAALSLCHTHSLIRSVAYTEPRSYESMSFRHCEVYLHFGYSAVFKEPDQVRLFRQILKNSWLFSVHPGHLAGESCLAFSVPDIWVDAE
jgi:hypothetical protein